MRHEAVKRATYVMTELAIFVHDVEQKFQAIPRLAVARADVRKEHEYLICVICSIRVTDC